MKKIIVLVASFGLLISTLQAQDYKNDSREKLQFGLKMGTNYSNVYDTKGDGFATDGKFGFVAGTFIAFPIGTIFGVQPEILFSQKGFHASGNLFGTTYDFTRTTSYLDIPLLFSFKPIRVLSILAGPQYSYLLLQKDVFTNAATTIEQEVEFENANIRKNTLCFLFGADFNVNHVSVGVRVGWDLFDNNGDGTTNTPQYKNVWYQATLAYKFF